MSAVQPREGWNRQEARGSEGQPYRGEAGGLGEGQHPEEVAKQSTPDEFLKNSQWLFRSSTTRASGSRACGGE